MRFVVNEQNMHTFWHDIKQRWLSGERPLNIHRSKGAGSVASTH